MARETLFEAGGQTYTLRLTLGALAEIEEALAVDGLKALAERLATLKSGELIVVLGALMRAGGSPDADPAGMEIDPGQAARAVAETFRASLS